LIDVVIIGAGITGGSLARFLSKYEGLDIHILEKEPDVAWGATKANTGIIHPGHEDDPEKYPVRAELCVEGNRIWHRWVEDLEIPSEWPGELMVARREEELGILKRYQEIGKENGVPELRIIEKEEIKSLEPNVSDDAVGALWAPIAGRMEPWEAVFALVENAVDNGVKVHLDTEVTDIEVKRGEVENVKTNKGVIESDLVLNAAGLFSDEISRMVGIDDFDIKPRKGEYYLFDEDAEPGVDKIIHPTPTPKTKGVYATNTVEGNLMLGPTAEDLSQDEKDNRATTEEGLDFIWEEASDLVRDLPPKKTICKSFAGLRPEPPDGDYIIESYENPGGFINISGIRSPGLTAAPAIAKYVTDELIEGEMGIELTEKKSWNPHREGMERFSEMDRGRQGESIEGNSKYGNVVCMCKEVTEAEVVQAIDRFKKLGNRSVTLDGIKFRTLAMFGSCQGSFCRLRVARIISREMDVPLWKVTKRGEGSEYGIGGIKTLRSESGGDSNE